jgi:hypothetical protein
VIFTANGIPWPRDLSLAFQVAEELVRTRRATPAPRWVDWMGDRQRARQIKDWL